VLMKGAWACDGQVLETLAWACDGQVLETLGADAASVHGSWACDGQVLETLGADAASVHGSMGGRAGQAACGAGRGDDC
jgi:hypothetical protein